MGEFDMALDVRGYRAFVAVIFTSFGLLPLVALPAAAQNEITIGAPLPLTGALSPEGEKLRAGYELWLAELDKTGGINVGGVKRKVKLIYSDYQSTTPRAVQLVEKLITSDKVDFMFSPFGSGAIKAASSVAEKYGMPIMASTASSKEVYDQNYKNLFGLYTPNNTLSEPISELVKAKFPDVKRVAILARNDLYPLALGNEFKKSAQARGLQVDYFEKYAIGTLDHAAAVTQIGALKPDWIIATGYINDLILIRQQMADQKVTAKVITGINGPQYKEWIDAVGAIGNGVTTASWFHSSVRYKSDDLFGSTEGFVKQFAAKYHSEPDFTQASGSAVGVILQMAIEAAGTLDRDKVRNMLAQREFKTFFAPIKFGPDGEANSYIPPVFQIQNGKVVVIYPDVIKQADLEPVTGN
jgi:branched-chain amino acid transport system substrate-binding protein